MVISPEGYYEVSLKGKSQQEILKSIRSLKKEISQLKRYIEEHSLETEKIYPTRLTRLKSKREYLERAIQAYQAAGGQYIHTKAEQKSQDFDSALDSIQRLMLSIGGYFLGWETRTYTVAGDKVIPDVDSFMWLKPGNLPVCHSFTRDEFIAGLKEIHIGEWKKNYDAPCVMDGTQWELEIHFDNRKPLKISGSNAFPYNFRDLAEFLGFEEELDEEFDEGQDED